MTNCPIHKQPMLRRATQYGPMYICTVDGCDMLKWGDSENTTPADTETRSRRHAAHQVFDKLWQDGHMTRDAAYEMLAGRMRLTRSQTHIGLFDRNQCDGTVQFAHNVQWRILLEKFK